MKKNIHPQYFKQAKIVCSCGNIIETGSTKPEIKVEVCSACHPFYTGKKKIIDTTGQVGKFERRLEKTVKMKTARKAVKKKREKAEKTTEKILKTTAKKKASTKKTSSKATTRTAKKKALKK